MSAPAPVPDQPVELGRSRTYRFPSRRVAILPHLGIRPPVAELVRAFLDEALPVGGEATVLDAGCGRVSALAPMRDRLGRLVGVDLHEPVPPLPWLDEFRIADVCTEAGAFPANSFDLILSSFTLEHFADPSAAVRNLAHWLRPGGTLVATTVNRAHPFVSTYLSLPPGARGPLQRIVKASAADAHPLVGACNTPALVRRTLADAGLSSIEVRTTGHLARAWQRRWPTFVVGLLGDLAAQPFPARRSTIVARASLPSGRAAAP